MKHSAILQKDHEGVLLLPKRMTPEERLRAYFYHSRLLYQLYQAGVKHRSGLLLSSRKRLPGQR